MTNKQEISTRHFAYIDGLRGVLAVYVVGHHFLSWNTASNLPRVLKLVGSVFGFGHAAVCAFIVLSGFSLMLPVAASDDGRVRGGFRKYITRRARRILPVYYAALGLSACAVLLASKIDPAFPNDLSATSILSHLLLIHTWISGQSGSINMALWSVATEWHIYFLFPLILLPVWRRFGSTGLVVAAFALGVLPQIVLAPKSELLLACPWFIGLFATGMAAAVVVGEPVASPRRTAGLGPTILGAAALAAYVGLKIVRPTSDVANGPSNLQWLKDGTCGLMVACLLIVYTRRSMASPADSRSRGIVLRMLDSRVARWFGLLSYSLYATHCAVFIVLRSFATRAELQPSAAFALMAAVGLPTAVGLAYLTSQWLEVPYLSSRARPPR